MNFMRGFGLTGLALLLCVAGAHAAPVRVSSWNLLPNSFAGANGWSQKYQQDQIREAAQELKKLNPDVILLQSVASWDSCNKLVQELKPENYKVVLCSSFRDTHGQSLSRQQVAILSKARAYISWSEAWQNGGSSPAAPGGFAFAAIQVDGKNTGFLSVQLGDGATTLTELAGVTRQLAREESTRQLIRQVAALQNWKTNRLEAVVVAGDFSTSADDVKFVAEKTLSQLQQAGFENALGALPLPKRVTWPANASHPDATVDYIFTQGIGRTMNPQISLATLSEHSGVTCELDLDAPKPAPPPQIAQAAPPITISEPTVAKQPATVTLANAPVANDRSNQLVWIAAILTGGLVLFVAVWRASRRSLAVANRLPMTKTQLLIPAKNTERIVVSPSSGTTVSDSSNVPFVHIEVAGKTSATSQTSSQPAIDPAIREGVIANLSRWMKEKMVRRLVTDRAGLLATQQAATLKLMAVDQRLSKIENQIEARNREYEERIDELLKELAMAREESRELIRAKIALVKAEMEKERLKSGQYLKEREQS